MRYCIGKDSGKWRVYDEYRREFAEPFTDASDKASARERAALKNEEYSKQIGAEVKQS